MRQRGPVNPNHFVVYDNGSTADIYYDDIQVFRLYTQDAGALAVLALMQQPVLIFCVIGRR